MKCNLMFFVPFRLKVKIAVVCYTVFILHFLSLTAAMQRKPKSYSSSLMDQIPIKFLIRQAQGLQQELGGICFACFLLLTFIVKKCGTVYNVIKCNRCLMVKNPTIQKWIPLYIPILLLAFTLPQNPVLFWNVISDIFSGKSNHMKLQVFNFFWPTKIQFHMVKANSYTHVKQLFF